MKITAGWVTQKATRRVMDALGDAWFVGGCVRNALLGLPVADIDIATTLVPDEVARRGAAAGLHVIPTGIEHGTVTLVSGGIPHEVTTFRRDVSTDGRRASVAFSADMAEDAARRDFTINALYADREGVVIDPLGGLDDLRARRVRFVGEAAQRIREDYLRILRFFRFSVLYAPDQPFDALAIEAISQNTDGLRRLSAERVTAELFTLLGAPDPGEALRVMAKIGVLDLVLPGFDLTAFPALVALEQQTSVGPDALRRLAVIVSDVPRLRLSRKQTDELALLHKGLADNEPPLVLGYRLNAAVATSVVLLRAAVHRDDLPQNWQADIETGASARFPIRAADLPDFSGAALGQELKRLEDTWLDSGTRLDRDALLSLPFPDRQSRL